MLRLVLALSLIALPAVAQKVTLEFDQGADFTHYRTFFLNEGQLNGKNPVLKSDIVRKNIQTAIRKRLMDRGLTEVASGPRDLNVGFTLGANRQKEVDVYPVGWWGARRVVTAHTEGTLVINLRDPKEKSLVWRTVTVEEKSDAAHIEQKLDDMVKKAFEQYPPKKK